MAKRKTNSLAQANEITEAEMGVFFTPKAGDKVNSMVIE